MSFYLASHSPRRRELLKQIGVRFQLLATAVDETPYEGEVPSAYVARMSEAKAEAGAAILAEHGDHHRVLGADTSVVVDGKILGKPFDRDDALQMLRLLSGRSHEVMSAITLLGSGRRETRLSITEVTFRSLSDELINQYWETGEPRDKAGAYGIQGLGAVFVAKMVGSYTGVVGLPLEELVPLLDAFEVPYWARRPGKSSS